ncbi:hypothetical protein K439DRAFT_1664504 [Ramaria rubella]|nr:hypothetical protein K439DRAFT_1664504 [Ramaria rubella]
MSSRKRKHTRRSSPDYNAGGEQRSSQSSASAALYVQAHEATIIRGRSDLAQALTTCSRETGKGGLIRWQGESPQPEVWVDRYDARLLLTSLPMTSRSVDASVTPPSPTGWSDLPSDSEDTFFFTPGEIEDLRREKRRKLMEAGREERLRAMQKLDPDPVRDGREVWGGDEEEPDAPQRSLMERTAKHLLTSPNPGQLEMRILANHGSDQRFAFLKGRWRNAWQAMKLVAKTEKDTSDRETTQETQGGLVVYGESDESDDEDPREDLRPEPNNEEDTSRVILSEEVIGEKEKEARKMRAREWAKQRKEEKNGDF